MAMEDLNLMLSSEDVQMQSVELLKQRIVTMTYELQLVQFQKEEEMRKRRESVKDMKQLLQMLQVAFKERDEARDELRKLLRKVNSGAALAPPVPSPGRTSSTLTESSGFSDTVTYNNNPSQGRSLYDIISPSIPPARSSAGKMGDTETRIVYNLAKLKTLPKKGELVDAVLDAGPLLQTLMLAAPLPRWRNSPPAQPIQAAPVGVGGHNQQAAIGSESGPPSLKRPFNNLVSGSDLSEVLANSALNFTAGGLSNARGLVSPAGIGLNQMIPSSKTQRTQ